MFPNMMMHKELFQNENIVCHFYLRFGLGEGSVNSYNFKS